MQFCKKYFWRVVVFSLFLTACRSSTIKPGKLFFSLLPEESTHINFNNRIVENDSVNFFTNEYMYIGSGVAVGDFNNDGLQDIFFCGNQVSCKLYLNKGNFNFDDITNKAGVETTSWCTGVSVLDINNDGLMDIYVCVTGSHDPQKRKNLLFINQGVSKDGTPTFKEEAADYGLADTGFSTQAVFMDYDKDGKMDMYLLNHRLYNKHPNDISGVDSSGNSPAEDRLYHNEGIPPGKDHPVFKDVSKAAGIKEDGYGLGVVVSDFNNDGWPDIYVANDYLSNDLLWLNNKNGTFTNVIAHSIRHQSYNSMGVDAADINNDGRADIAVLDMLPATNQRKKLMFSGETPERYDMERRLGYQPEFTRNMLQLNNGTRMYKDTVMPFFSEIGQLAGISETDWSWSVLMADFDNDGWKDMYITNGLDKDLTNNDFLFFQQSFYDQGYQFENSNKNEGILSKDQIEKQQKELDKYGSRKINNYFFHNDHDLTFDDVGDACGLGVPTVSQGAVYVDLDNDGDLDLVVNNMNQTASIWKNDLRMSLSDTINNFLTIKLQGDRQNVEGIGAKLWLYTKNSMQYLEQSPVRGYLSSVDNRLHFGVGNLGIIDSLKIEWPDNKEQVIKNIKTNQFLAVKYSDATGKDQKKIENRKQLFTEANSVLKDVFQHHEIPFFDYAYQPMLPQKYSQLGPCLAVGDMNGDGLSDFFIGGAANQSGKLYFQNKNGAFISKNLSDNHKPQEDDAAVLFDANGDKAPDLLVAGGSYEFGGNSPNNDLRLYLNDSKGNFSLDSNAFPRGISVVSQSVAVADYDGDGDLDVFVAGRIVPQYYPAIPRSYLFQNNRGKFTDVTKDVCPDLMKPGMITSAIFTDFNNDGKPDLIICGEWMPIRFFENRKGKFVEVTKSTGLPHENGMWRSISQVDINHDGKMDYVVGNMGLNNKYHPSPARPLMLYAKNVDNNRSMALVPAYYIIDNDNNFQLYPGLDRNQIADEIPSIKKKYLLHRDFANVTMDNLISDIGGDGWIKMDCETMESVWLENLGNGKFRKHALPVEAQFAPINTILPTDVDGDGNIDLILAGNEYQANPVTGRYDASYGIILKGDGKGNFIPLDPATSGFVLDGDVKQVKEVTLSDKRKLIVAAINDEKIKCFLIKTNKP